MQTLLDSMGLTYIYEHPVRSGFILDFAFPEKMKAIEVDGHPSHFTSKGRRRDRFRDWILGRAGWRILRVTADELRENPRETAQKITVFLSN